MAAPALSRSSTREQLLEAGRDLMQRHGVHTLTVRAVATAARANLGSFVYHFGTRDAFVRELLETWYAPLMSRVETVDPALSPVGRLRQAIVQVIDFAAENEALIGHLFTAALAGDRSTRSFLGSLSGRHPRVLLQRIVEAQVAGELEAGDPLQVACFLMASVGLPRVIAAGWQGPALFPAPVAAVLRHIACDRDHILQRLDWALRGLSPRDSR